MLDFDTLSALHDLMARTLYSAEVKHLPKLSREEEEAIIARARSGDAEARAMLVVSCLSYAFGRAVHLYVTRQPYHDEALDLAQVASLAMTESLDEALSKRNPASYLRGIAARAMSIYLTYYSGLIRKPGFSLEKLATVEIPTVERLDVPVSRERAAMRIDLVEMAPEPEDTEDVRERFAPLYEALSSLTPRQRARLARRYGLDVGELEPEFGGEHHSLVPILTKLRKALLPRLAQILKRRNLE